MSKTILYSCDQCSSPITDTSFAFVAFSDDMHRKNGSPAIARLALHPWREDMADSPKASHLCGTSCASRELAFWTQKVDVQRASQPIVINRAGEGSRADIPAEFVDTVA